MVQALWAKVRSPDVSTQHGCIIVNSDKQIAGQGYNGYPRGVDDDKMPQTRPEKYGPILHADENAILNSNEFLEGATMYITGPPCTHCWAQIIQKRIDRVVIGPIRSKSADSAHIEDNPFNEVVQNMLEHHDIEIVQWQPDNSELIQQEIEVILQLVCDNVKESMETIAKRVMDENRDLLKRLADS